MNTPINTPLVLTVTPHPAIDQTITLDAPLQPGQVQRARQMQQQAGGKGVNVALALALYGVPTAATGLLGKDNAAVFEQCLQQYGIADQFIRTPGASRCNIKLHCPQHTTDINLPAPLQLTPQALQQLEARCAQAPWLALCGSLPPDCPEDFYVACCAHAARHACVLDTSGAALHAVLQAAQQAPQLAPFAIKPNLHELSHYLGHALDGLPAIYQAARRLQGATGIVWVVVSLGAEGALFCHATLGAVHAQIALADISQSTVGAGDFMVAGLLTAFLQQADLETTARMATAFAAYRLTTAVQNWNAQSMPTTITQWMQQVHCQRLSNA